MIIDVSDFEVHVASSANGPFARIEDLTSHEGTHGSEDSTRTRVFGKTDPYVRAGENTDEYSLDGLYNPEDTNGQNVLRDSRDNRTTIYLAVVTDPTPGAEKGYIQPVICTEYSESGDADGEYLECSFSLESAGARGDIPPEGLPTGV